MRLKLLMALAISAVLAPTNPDARPDTPTFTDLSGETVSISAEDPVVLHFWATWCPSCLEELDLLQSISKKSRCGTSLKLIVVNTGEAPDVVSAFVEKHSLDLELLLDPKGSAFRRLVGGGLPANLILRSGPSENQILHGPLSEAGWLELLGCH